MCREVLLRIIPFPFRHKADARKAQPRNRLRLLRIHLALDPHEGLIAAELRLYLADGKPEDPGQPYRGSAPVLHQARMGKDRRGVEADHQHPPAPIIDRPALGSHGDAAFILPFGSSTEMLVTDDLNHVEASADDA
jgi:hypothetical protein